jgi:hypothetical protein
MRMRGFGARIGTLVVIFGMTLAVTSTDAATPDAASWQQAVSALTIPAAGCFTAQFPVVAWRAVSCQKAPDIPLAPASQGAPASTVGNGLDYSATTSGPLFKMVKGSFPSVSAGTTEKGIDPVDGTTWANAFSLQLNSSFFSGSPACKGAAVPKQCQAWQQFALTTSPDPGDSPFLFMQYWLIDYSNPCPAGWFTFDVDCYTNSNATSFPALKASQLSTVSLEGSAKAGGSDKDILTTGTTDYAVSASDSVVDLAPNWNTAEFGLFGDGNGTGAKFSTGTTIKVMTETSNGTKLAPSCSLEGFTGETNNLSLVKTPKSARGSSPAIVSEQSNTGTKPASCQTSP